jgi:hypothetical protein
VFVVLRAEDGRTHCRLSSTRTNDYLSYSVSVLLLHLLLSRATSVTHGHLAVSANLGAHDGTTIADHGFVAGLSTLFFTAFVVPLCVFVRSKRRGSPHPPGNVLFSVSSPWAFYICAWTGGLKGKKLVG